MEDLDSYLRSEIDSINDMFEEFQTKDERHEKRKKSEELKLQEKDLPSVKNEGLKVSGIEEVTERRMKESEELERRYQLEMQQLEEDRLRALEEEKAMKRRTLESDVALQNLDKEWENLLAQEEQLVKETQKEKEAREKREKEEQERREKERKEKAAEQEMTVEEWIQWMEEKKKKGMTTEQQMEYERRKRAWMEREKEREEKRKTEEMEKIRRTRAKMEEDYRHFQIRDQEVRANRLSAHDIQKLQEEQTRQRAEERKAREEKTRKKTPDGGVMKHMEEVRPKAKWGLAAKWEEQAHSRQD